MVNLGCACVLGGTAGSCVTLLKQSPTLRACGRAGRMRGGLGAPAGARALTAAWWFTENRAPAENRTPAGHGDQNVNAALGQEHGNPEQGQGGRYLGARCCSCQCAAQECC